MLQPIDLKWTDEHVGALIDEADAAHKRIAELEAAIYEATGILGALSMATTGHMRGRICSASNRLSHAVYRTLSVHGDQPCKSCGKFDACVCNQHES